MKFKLVRIGAFFDGFRTLKDRTFNFNFCSQEPTTQQIASLCDVRHQFGELQFAVGDDAVLEEPIKLISPGPQGKSQSQRLRAVIFRYHQTLGSELEFEEFYKQQMEKLIDWYKSKLD